ncbi:hypothetical protein ACO0K0_20395 [Undibacterium sp. SXout11W]|uniref:hypothetical protein n=1 Tax=Undibacterium sp. SXout11W TaxID=3413050 RepID=UPI003BF36879
MSLKSKSLSNVRDLPAVSILMEEEQVRINLNVAKSLRNKWKAEALKQEKTMTDLILEAMKIYSHE